MSRIQCGFQKNNSATWQRTVWNWRNQGQGDGTPLHGNDGYQEPCEAGLTREEGRVWCTWYRKEGKKQGEWPSADTQTEKQTALTMNTFNFWWLSHDLVTASPLPSKPPRHQLSPGTEGLTLGPGLVRVLSRTLCLLESCLRADGPESDPSLALGLGRRTVSSFLKRVKTSQGREEAVCRHISSECHLLW